MKPQMDTDKHGYRRGLRSSVFLGGSKNVPLKLDSGFPRSRRHSLRRGFTLLEILLTMVVLALLLSGVYAVLVGTIQAVERVEYVTQRSEIGPGILRIVARDFEHAVMPGGRPAGAFLGKNQGYGAFSTDRVDFVANVPTLGPFEALGGKGGAPPRPSPMNEVGYRLMPNPFAPGLFRLFRRESYYVDEDPLSGGMLFEVYDRVRSFQLEYFDGKEWRPQWSSLEMGGMPVAVRVGMTIEVGTPDAERSTTTTDEGNVKLLSYQLVVMIPR
jgi:type II secretion system protein J